MSSSLQFSAAPAGRNTQLRGNLLVAVRDGAAKQSRRQTGQGGGGHQDAWAWDGSAGTGTGSQAVIGHLGPPGQSSSQPYGKKEQEQEEEEVEEKNHKTEGVDVRGAVAGGRADEAGLDRPPLSQDKWTGEAPTHNSIQDRAGEKQGNGNHNQISALLWEMWY